MPRDGNVRYTKAKPTERKGFKVHSMSIRQVEHQTRVREVMASNPDWTNTQGLKLKLFSAKKRLEKNSSHSKSESISKMPKNGHNAKAIAHAKHSVWVKK